MKKTLGAVVLPAGGQSAGAHAAFPAVEEGPQPGAEKPSPKCGWSAEIKAWFTTRLPKGVASLKRVSPEGLLAAEEEPQQEKGKLLQRGAEKPSPKCARSAENKAWSTTRLPKSVESLKKDLPEGLLGAEGELQLEEEK